MEEIWKPIPLFYLYGIYEASNHGRIRRIRTFAGLSKTQVDTIVQACKQGKSIRSLAAMFHVDIESITRIMRLHDQPYAILKPWLNYGYLHIKLSVQGKVSRYSVAELVLSAFDQPRPPDMTVNHKNGIRNDNRAENLEWLSLMDNHRHAREVLNSPIACDIGERNNHAKLKPADIPVIRNLRASGFTYRRIAALYDVDASNIGYIITKKTWKHIP